MITRTGFGSPRAPNIKSPQRLTLTSAVVVAALTSLFLSLDQVIGPVRLRLFDLMSVVSIGFMATSMGFSAFMPRRELLPVLLFFLVHVSLAAAGGISNVAREGVQVTIIFLFATTFLNYLSVSSDQKIMFKWFCRMVLLVMCANIAIHISSGVYSGWKQFDSAKAAFVILPTLIAASTHDRLKSPYQTYGILILGAVIILLSGERKAYLLTALLIALLVGLNLRLAAVGFAAGLLVIAIAAFDPRGVVEQQITSIFSSSDSSLEAAVSPEARLQSLSNAQRQFALRRGMELLRERPLLGVGTNQYLGRAADGYSVLPDYMKIGIHSEFVRVLVENGALGLVAYVFAWLTAAWALLRNWSGQLHLLFVGARGPLLTATMLFASFLIYCTLEASTTVSLLVFALAPAVSAIIIYASGDRPPQPAPRARARVIRNERYRPAAR